MKMEEYRKAVMVTAQKEISCQNVNGHLLHGAMGLVTEAGELMDALKRNLAYGKPIDTINIQEEIQDSLWYIVYLCETQGFDIEKMMEANIAKLRKRFGEKFNEFDALNRNLKEEREVLEKSLT